MVMAPSTGEITESLNMEEISWVEDGGFCSWILIAPTPEKSQ